METNNLNEKRIEQNNMNVIEKRIENMNQNQNHLKENQKVKSF